MDKVAAVILTGGKSTRMGCDKACLPLHGKRLADVVAGVVREAGISDIFVSGWLDGYVSIPDLVPGQGPVGGICASVAVLAGRYEQVLFVPVDMPLLLPESIRTLLHTPKPFACHFAQHPLPLLLQLDPGICAYTRSIHQQIEDAGTLSVKRYLTALNPVAISIPAALTRSLSNTNTPEQWQEALHEYPHRHPPAALPHLAPRA